MFNKPTSIKISNTKVIVNGKEVNGFKKLKYLIFGYALIPVLMVFIIGFIQGLLTGAAVALYIICCIISFFLLLVLGVMRLFM